MISESEEEEGPAIAELASVAEALVKAGRRDEAIAMVESVVGPFSDEEALLLLARLHLDSGTRSGARAAIAVLDMCRGTPRWGLDGIVLLHRAFREVGCGGGAAKLDHEIRWMRAGGPAQPCMRRS